MTYILMNDEQLRLIAEAAPPVVFVDAKGREVGKLAPFPPTKPPIISEAELAELKLRMESPGPGKTTKELLEHLTTLAPIQG